MNIDMLGFTLQTLMGVTWEEFGFDLPYPQNAWAARL